MINPKLKEVFQQHNIDYSEGMVYLLAVYYKVPFNDNLKKALEKTIVKVNVSHIMEREYSTGDIKWNMPLFNTQEIKWFWVDEEYRKLFKNIRPDRAGTSVTCLRRMKELFRENPEIRKEDVMEATRLYISEVNSDYLQGADYFIKKGVGASATSKLMEHLERIALKKEVDQIRNLNLMGE